MENVNMNKKPNINDELLDDISGGIIPKSTQSYYCDICGKLTPDINLVNHHLKKVCKKCLEKISNK